MPKEKILVHACCATCAGFVLQQVAEKYVPVIYYYNPNIYPIVEYALRRDELKHYAIRQGFPFIEEKYQPMEWSKTVQGLENEPEKGLRCNRCFFLRLDRAASFAKENSIRIFTTTLTISPHKNSLSILEIGNQISADKQVSFLGEDFKKKDGFKKTMEIARTEGFYRQNYCGCQYSQRQ